MKNILLFLILVLAFFLRGQETLFGNFLFLKDQGRDLLAVKSIVVDSKLTLIGPYTGLQAVFQGPLYYYLLAIPFALSGGDPRAIMWLMLAASMFAVLFVYEVGKRFFSVSAGIFAAFLASVSPAAAAAATFIWSPFLTLPLSALALLFFLSWIKKYNTRSVVLLAASLGILFHFEIAFATPFALVVFILCVLNAKAAGKPFGWFAFISVIALFLLPLIVFDLRHDYITSRSVLRLVRGGTQGLSGGEESYAKVMYDHAVHFIIHLKTIFIDDVHVRSILASGFLIGSAGYALFGTLQSIQYLFAIPWLLFAVYLLYPFQIYDWYLVGLYPVYFLLGGYFLDRLRQFAVGKIIVMGICMLFLVNSGVRIWKLYKHPDVGGTSKIAGKIQAIDTIYDDAAGLPFSVRVFTPVVLTDAYDYLFWWHGNKTYGYIPGTDSIGTLYLLIEPDPSKPWTYEGWLQTVIQKGKVLETRELPSGFIIQKRSI